jgi:hypothetical protein
MGRARVIGSCGSGTSGGISIVLYAAMNYMSSGALVIADAVIAIGLFIAFYYGLTGFACAWYYRKNLTSSARNLWMQGILPIASGLMLYFLGGWSVWLDYNVATENDYTMWTVPGLHWQVGGAFVIAVIAVLIGLACYIYCRITRPAFWLMPAINPILELEISRWPRPCSATSAGQIPACSQRCVAFGSKYATWNPS